jgi:hypothetical protein
MAENKTLPTDINPIDFIEQVEDETRKKDAYTILELMHKITAEPPVMWGPSIIGFGSYSYTYASGHSGIMCRIGFSPRKTELVLYLVSSTQKYDELILKLGKVKTSKACLYIKKLQGVDMGILEQLIKESYKEMEKLYPSKPNTI